MFLEKADCDGLIRYLGAHALIPEVKNRAQDQRGYLLYVWRKRYGQMAVAEIRLRRLDETQYRSHR